MRNTYGVLVIAGSFGFTVTGKLIFGLIEVEGGPLLSADCAPPKRNAKGVEILGWGKSIFKRVGFLGPTNNRLL